jgi:hypothetical protein
MTTWLSICLFPTSHHLPPSFLPSLPPSRPPSVWDIFSLQWVETIRNDEGDEAAEALLALFAELGVEESLEVRKERGREGGRRKKGPRFTL